MASISRNVASQNVTFCLINSTTGAAITGASITGYVTKDGTQAGSGGTFTGLGNGQYNYAPTQAETNCTDFGLFITATSAIPVNLDFHTDVVDANGLPSVDVAYINAVATSAVTTVKAVQGLTTADTITTTTNLTNAATAGDFTATMKTSIGTAVAASAVASVTGNVGGNVTGSVGSISGVTFPTRFSALAIDSSGDVTFNNTSIATVTNLTNAATSGDFTSTMKTSLNNSTPASITGAVGSVTGNVGGNVVGSVGSVTGAVGSVTGAVTVGTVNASASNIKKDVALAGFMFLMTNSTTHQPQTGLTVAGTVALDGGAFGSLTNAVSEIANGWYTINLAAADLNGNNVALRFTATGADDRDIYILTQK